jgi:hypothetical protein
MSITQPQVGPVAGHVAQIKNLPFLRPQEVQGFLDVIMQGFLDVIEIFIFSYQPFF